MIALLFADRCVACNQCVQVCPANVFDPRASGPPEIARAEDCSTCFLCELYCRADALYVAPDWDRAVRSTLRPCLRPGLLDSTAATPAGMNGPNSIPTNNGSMETVFRRAAEQTRGEKPGASPQAATLPR